MAVVNSSFTYFNIPTRSSTTIPNLSQKDFTKPLHVDCSVEYELPNSAKPPVGTKNEPLLMIHPSYYRREESQNRSPFVNNLPQKITNYMGSGGSRRSQMRISSSSVCYQQQQQQSSTTTATTTTSSSSSAAAAASKSQSLSCGVGGGGNAAKTSGNRPPLICSSNEAVNRNEIGIFRRNTNATERSPMRTVSSTDILRSDVQTAVNDTTRYLAVMKDNKPFITDILPSVCQDLSSSATSKVVISNGNSTSGGGSVASRRLQRIQQQPAVGVAAVAPSTGCTGCNPCMEAESCGYLLPQHHARMQHQPWSGMTAPQFPSFSAATPGIIGGGSNAPTATMGGGGAKYRKTLDSPAATNGSTAVAAAAAVAASFSLLQKRGTPWPLESTPVPAKRSKGTVQQLQQQQQQQQQHHHHHLQEVEKAAVAAQNAYSAANFTQWCNNILPSYTSSSTDCCKMCQQQQWNYTSHCRAASSNTASSIIWNNENMLRLFQV